MEGTRCQTFLMRKLVTDYGENVFESVGGFGNFWNQVKIPLEMVGHNRPVDNFNAKNSILIKYFFSLLLFILEFVPRGIFKDLTTFSYRTLIGLWSM